MAAARPVGVHVGDDAEGAFAAQHAGDRIVLVGQFLERAFHPPFGHGLAGMLAGVEPDVERALADRQAVDVLAVEALAERAVGDDRQAPRSASPDRGAAPSNKARNRRSTPVLSAA